MTKAGWKGWMALLWAGAVCWLAGCELAFGQEARQSKVLPSYAFGRSWLAGSSNEPSSELLLFGQARSVKVVASLQALKQLDVSSAVYQNVWVSSGTGVDGMFTWQPASVTATNYGTVFTGSTNNGASELSTGRWFRNLAALGVIYLDWFGTVRDGATDDTARVSSFIDTIPANGEGVVGPGTYALATSLTKTKSKFWLRGMGSQSVFKATGTNAWLLLISGSDVHLSDLALDGNFKDKDLLYQDNRSKRWLVERVFFHDNYLDNVLDPGGTGSLCWHRITKGAEDVTLVDNIYSNITYSATGWVSRTAKGVWATGFGSASSADYIHRIKIRGCKFLGVHGDTLHDSDAIAIQDQIDGEPFDADIDQCSFVTWDHRAVKEFGNGIRTHHCSFDNRLGGVNTFSAISIYGTSKADHNDIRGFWYVGIDLDSNVQANNVGSSVDHNKIVYTGADYTVSSLGIYTTLGVTNVTIDHNYVENVRWGIGLRSATVNPSVTMNTLSNIYEYGIYANDDPTGGLTGTFPQRAYIEGNMVVGMGAAGAGAAIKLFWGTNFHVINNRGDAGAGGFLVMASEGIGRHWGNQGEAQTAAELRGARQELGSDYTITTNDYRITVTATHTLTLPAAAGVPSGQAFVVYSKSGVITTVTRTGGDTINQAASDVSVAALGTAEFVSDGVSNYEKR